MCRLFGLYANKPIDVVFSFYTAYRSFAEQSKENPSGWGVAWLNGKWHLHKEPLPLHKSAKAKELVKKHVRGRIIVSHVRLASMGAVSLENTHPWIYRGWIFAHNGTADRSQLLKLLKHQHRSSLEGTTDFEALHRLVVQEAEEKQDPVEGIRSAVNKILESSTWFTALNFIASNGENLYALRYTRESPDYYTLHYLERPCEATEIHKLSPETRQLIASKLAKGEKAVIVASEPLTEEPNWKPIPNKHLAIINRNIEVEIVKLH